MRVQPAKKISIFQREKALKSEEERSSLPKALGEHRELVNWDGPPTCRRCRLRPSISFFQSSGLKRWTCGR